MKFTKGLLVFASATLLAACGAATTTNNEGGSTDEGDTIKIGGNWELSGNVSAYGISQNNGIKIAVAEINEAGGINGKQIEYIEYDNKSTPEEATAGATRLTDVDNVSLILGPATTGSVNAQVPTVTAAATPMITPSATGDAITLDQDGKALEYVFRVCFQDAFQGVALAEFANQKGYTNAAVIMDNGSDYGQNLASEFKDTFAGEIVAEESYVTKDTDFQSILTNIKSTNPEVIFVAGYYEEAGTLIKQAREMGITAPIVGPDGFGNTEIINLAGAENMSDVYYTAHFVNSDNAEEDVKAFTAAYEGEYGSEPDMFAALAYDAAYLAFDAIERAGSADKQAITDALADTKEFDGVTGNFSIDENHNPVKTAFIVELQKGEPVGSTAIDPK